MLAVHNANRNLLTIGLRALNLLLSSGTMHFTLLIGMIFLNVDYNIKWVIKHLGPDSSALHLL